MRTRVTCANCGIVWDRVACTGNSVEFTEDICLVCPACGSNAYEVLPGEKAEMPVYTPENTGVVKT